MQVRLFWLLKDTLSGTGAPRVMNVNQCKNTVARGCNACNQSLSVARGGKWLSYHLVLQPQMGGYQEGCQMTTLRAKVAIKSRMGQSPAGHDPSLVAWSPQSLGLKVLQSSLAFIYCCCYTVHLIKNNSITAGQLYT